MKGSAAPIEFIYKLFCLFWSNADFDELCIQSSIEEALIDEVRVEVLADGDSRLPLAVTS